MSFKNSDLPNEIVYDNQKTTNRLIIVGSNVDETTINDIKAVLECENDCNIKRDKDINKEIKSV